MKIFSISHKMFGWDMYLGHIVVAHTEEEVRALAISMSADEGEQIWKEVPVLIEGEYTGSKTEPFILLSSFVAGEHN